MKGSFSQSGRPGKKYMVKRFPAVLGGLQKNGQIVLFFFLADEVAELLRPERRVVFVFAVMRGLRKDPVIFGGGHVISPAMLS